jgi:isopenicillin N synthase-like dioxygenase
MSIRELSDLKPALVDEALSTGGGFLLPVDSGEAALAAARAMFALPEAAKQVAAIEHSPHFHGWSQMRNERDWREQFHFGREVATREGEPFHRLEGPNLWPAGGDRARIESYLEAVSALGERVLQAVAGALAVTAFSRDGYAILKLIGYHPQASTGIARPGVAAHVDFSWITLTLQDSPGLEVLPPGGDWTLVEPRPGSLWVHAGELLELVTRGRYPATPHRVVNRSIERSRVSIPFFVNPPLDGLVAALPQSAPAEEPAHVHRVIDRRLATGPFHFGRAEWRRKGLNHWCHVCTP